jgi:hypothetical protein
VRRSDPWCEAPGGEGVSRNASEPVSASLRTCERPARPDRVRETCPSDLTRGEEQPAAPLLLIPSLSSSTPLHHSAASIVTHDSRPPSPPPQCTLTRAWNQPNHQPHRCLHSHWRTGRYPTARLPEKRFIRLPRAPETFCRRKSRKSGTFISAPRSCSATLIS